MSAAGSSPSNQRPRLRLVEGGGLTSAPVDPPIELVSDRRHPYADFIELMVAVDARIDQA